MKFQREQLELESLFYTHWLTIEAPDTFDVWLKKQLDE